MDARRPLLHLPPVQPSFFLGLILLLSSSALDLKMILH